jgi:hypothetical protein
MIAFVASMRRALFLTLGLAVAAGMLRAQSGDDDEDEMDYFPLVPTGNSLQFGMRFIGGPKVSFGKLGYLPGTASFGDPTGAATRIYDDGAVSLDPRVDSNGAPVNDGLTNTWTYQFASQVTPSGDMAFHAYSATTMGAGLDGKKNSAAGWELQIGHSFGKIGGKVEFDLVAGFSFNSVLSKVSGTVPALLTTVTDTYSLYGQAVPTAPYTAPSSSSQQVLDANGNPVLGTDGSVQTVSTDTSTLLGSQPSRTTTTSQTNVNGQWEIKGSYYTFRVGPVFKIPITERLKLSLGAGVGMIYIGTTYIAQESVDLTDVATPLQELDQSTHSVARPAYYGDADAEYWLTERSGFYLGATYQKSGNYDQTVGGRTAQIDLGSTYGLQSGITLRF